MINFDNTFQSASFLKEVGKQVEFILDKRTKELEAKVKGDSPNAFGTVRSGWEQRVEGRGINAIAIVENRVDYAFYGIVGRGPGTPPPVSALFKWAKLKGISPYAVQKSIRDKGTERWRDNKNAIGWDRTSNMWLDDAPVIVAQNQIRNDLNKIFS